VNVPISSTDTQIHLTVIGAGYLGITHAACMASLGFRVLAVEADAAKVADLNAGHLPIYEPGLPELLRSGLATGRLTFTTSYDEAALFGDVHFICTGTPQTPGRDQADLSQVTGAVMSLTQRLTHRCLIAGKSTVPVGTARKLATMVAQEAPQAEVAWNPEFLREGTAVTDTLKPARIVAGVTSQWAEDLLRRVYAASIAGGARFFTATLETAELAKVAANAFLATKITFINATAEVCEAAGADARTLAQILRADPRIGGEYLRPGLGFGGACLPKDIRAFVARADELGTGQALSFLREMDAINLRCRTRVVDLALTLVGGNLTGIPVCALWAACCCSPNGPSSLGFGLTS
jgi:UDPglucose 6-dehydrogenase